MRKILIIWSIVSLIMGILFGGIWLLTILKGVWLFIFLTVFTSFSVTMTFVSDEVITYICNFIAKHE